MPEHFTKGTVAASFWCKKCAKPTMHRVDTGRRGPCLVCLANLENAVGAAPKPPAPPEAPTLFGELHRKFPRGRWRRL